MLGQSNDIGQFGGRVREREGRELVQSPLTLAENVGLLVVAQMPGARSRQGPGPASTHDGVKALMRRRSRRRQIQTAGDTDTTSEIEESWLVVPGWWSKLTEGGEHAVFGPVSPSVASICPGLARRAIRLLPWPCPCLVAFPHGWIWMDGKTDGTSPCRGHHWPTTSLACTECPTRPSELTRHLW